MSCKLSTTFKLSASIRVTRVIKYFQFFATMKMQQHQLSLANIICCTLSQLSDLNTFLNETARKLLTMTKRLRAFMLIGRPNYTSLLAAGRKIGGA